jgi:hypothetical protein
MHSFVPFEIVGTIQDNWVFVVGFHFSDCFVAGVAVAAELLVLITVIVFNKVDNFSVGTSVLYCTHGGPFYSSVHVKRFAENETVSRQVGLRMARCST